MFPFRQRHDGWPQRVVRRKHAMIAVPVLPQRWHEIGYTIQKLKRREFNDAVGIGTGEFSRPSRADPGLRAEHQNPHGDFFLSIEFVQLSRLR